MPATPANTPKKAPLQNLDERENELLLRYPKPGFITTRKVREEKRDYGTPGCKPEKEFYRLRHENQTDKFAVEKRSGFHGFNKKEMQYEVRPY